MLVDLNKLNGSTINAVDGEIGKVKDVYFDDRYWTIRFLVVDIQPWVPLSQKTLISPISLLDFNFEEQLLNVSMSKDLVKHSPGIEEHEPVSREFERKYFDYYGYGYYWMGPEPWGQYTFPTALVTRQKAPVLEQDDVQPSNHLRSADEITHYGIVARDGKKGYVKDFIWDTDNWSLRFIVLDTREWLPGGKKVLIAPEKLGSLSWEDQTLTCHMSVEQIKACPEYSAEKLNDPDYLEAVQKAL
ncbi:PRC-barrel domain containing protein [Motilimonas cestriensis]|uniref:PRC-barrel domain containing protein n=1 Tax=Motilimonas cestriensis TaxID=2742685 RepID=A0ABS8W7Z0_9GAMM|nr:PRC-barrel domain containing protein [Motilimonas cestriensis]MCE2594390.1 PRC-barrel domain containing protein [Motilimonas cestriensis]